jgi:hypothetical protein
MVKVRTIVPLLTSTLPKSVWSAALGVASPLALLIRKDLAQLVQHMAQVGARLFLGVIGP